MISKNKYYKPRYKLYRTHKALVTILDGIVGLIVSPFGYDSNILIDWSSDSMRKDINRMKAKREQRRKEMKDST